jgi:hypothetical protein
MGRFPHLGSLPRAERERWRKVAWLTSARRGEVRRDPRRRGGVVGAGAGRRRRPGRHRDVGRDARARAARDRTMSKRNNAPTERNRTMKDSALVRYDQAPNALAACVRVDDVKPIRDKALAMQVYAQQAKDTALIEQATEIRLRAEIRAGELLAEMKVNGTRRKPADNTPPPKGKPKASNTALPAMAPTLTDLGISKMQSSRWQKLAALPRGEQEAVIGGTKSKAVQTVQSARAKSAAKSPPTYDEDDGVSRAAVACALEVRAVVGKFLKKIPRDEWPGLKIALRDEWKAIAFTLNRGIKFGTASEL